MCNNPSEIVISSHALHFWLVNRRIFFTLITTNYLLRRLVETPHSLHIHLVLLLHLLLKQRLRSRRLRRLRLVVSLRRLLVLSASTHASSKRKR